MPLGRRRLRGAALAFTPGGFAAGPRSRGFCRVARDRIRPMSAVLAFLPEAQRDAEEATRYYEERVRLGRAVSRRG